VIEYRVAPAAMEHEESLATRFGLTGGRCAESRTEDGRRDGCSSRLPHCMQKHAPAKTSARHLEQARFKASVGILYPFPNVHRLAPSRGRSSFL
jgi:hypothetical protein